MNTSMLLKIVAVTCLVATLATATPFSRQARNLQQAPSQLEPRSVAAPAEAAAKAAAQQAKLHYVEIDPSLKGNYKFGYDTGSGPAGQSFREETRLDDGTVKGAYGYVDANGKQRIVKYTAGKAGFVVEGDQEASGQQGAQTPAGAPAQQAEPQRRPQPVNLPQQQQPQSQPTFDEPQQQPQQFSRATPAGPSAEDRARAEQQHAEQLRQHQLATQAALAQQQRLAQQLQLQQQQIIAAQRQAPTQQPQQQHQPSQQHQFAVHFPQQQQQHQLQQQAQPQFQQQPRHHAHIVDPQSGSFFSSSNDASLDQLLKSQLAQLQGTRGGVPEQFLGPHQRPVAAQAAPAFHQAGAQQAPDFSQFRAARQAPQSAHLPHQHQHQAALTPQTALAALQQQQQQDAQMLAQLRAQQLARFQEQARQSPQAQLQQQEQAAHFRAQPQAQAFASQSQPLPVHQRAPAPEAFASQPAPVGPTSASASVVAQPENFGPPVIDIRTLNYSIGQQTRV